MNKAPRGPGLEQFWARWSGFEDISSPGRIDRLWFELMFISRFFFGSRVFEPRVTLRLLGGAAAEFWNFN